MAIVNDCCAIHTVVSDDESINVFEATCTREPGHSGKHVACVFRATMEQFKNYHRLVSWSD